MTKVLQISDEKSLTKQLAMTKVLQMLAMSYKTISDDKISDDKSLTKQLAMTKVLQMLTPKQLAMINVFVLTSQR